MLNERWLERGLTARMFKCCGKRGIYFKNVIANLCDFKYVGNLPKILFYFLIKILGGVFKFIPCFNGTVSRIHKHFLHHTKRMSLKNQHFFLWFGFIGIKKETYDTGSC